MAMCRRLGVAQNKYMTKKDGSNTKNKACFESIGGTEYKELSHLSVHYTRGNQ